MLDGLDDLDGGFVRLDLERVYQLTLPDELDDFPHSWQWILARCYTLFDLDTFTRKEVLTRGL